MVYALQITGRIDMFTGIIIIISVNSEIDFPCSFFANRLSRWKRKPYFSLLRQWGFYYVSKKQDWLVNKSLQLVVVFSLKPVSMKIGSNYWIPMLEPFTVQRSIDIYAYPC